MYASGSVSALSYKARKILKRLYGLIFSGKYCAYGKAILLGLAHVCLTTAGGRRVVCERDCNGLFHPLLLEQLGLAIYDAGNSNHSAVLYHIKHGQFILGSFAVLLACDNSCSQTGATGIPRYSLQRRLSVLLTRRTAGN